VSTDGHRHTHTRTDAKRFYYLSHAICYSYGADNNALKAFVDFGFREALLICDVVSYLYACDVS